MKPRPTKRLVRSTRRVGYVALCGRSSNPKGSGQFSNRLAGRGEPTQRFLLPSRQLVWLDDRKASHTARFN